MVIWRVQSTGSLKVISNCALVAGIAFTDPILLGNISQWGEVKKKTKDRSQSKVKDPAVSVTDVTAPSARGGRGRGGHEGTRGGRGRGSDRGRGISRGGRAGSTANGPRHTRPEKTVAEPVGDTGGWDETPKIDGVIGDWDQPVDNGATPLESSWENVTVAEANPTFEPPKPSLKPDGTRSWASIFNKPVPAPAPKKGPTPPAVSEEHTGEVQEVEQPSAAAEGMPGLPPPVPMEDAVPETINTPPASAVIPSEPALDITPSKDQLTETNLEQLPDVSEPAPVATAASTVASTIDQRAAGSNTPLHASQQQLDVRPPLGGYATSAYKAAGMAGRSASFQRKVMEQQEAVVMPGKHAVDHAALQFGSMGLNGTTEDLDVDSDREEAETRAQPPQHSPIAPRASLPPASQVQGLPGEPPIEPLPTTRQAPGLPPPSQQPSAQALPEQSLQQSSQSGYPYNQYGSRYGLQDGQQDTSAPAQKAYEPFGQQLQPSQHQYSGYPTASQPQAPLQNPQSQMGAYSSAPSETSSYYTSDSQRNAYQNYYGSYGQQPQQHQQDSGMNQQRGGSAFGTSAPEQAPQYATSHAHQQPQSRYGQAAEAQNSGQSTPNTALPSQQQPHQAQQGQQMHQHAQGQTNHQGAYPYNHPYYASPYYSHYMSQQVNNHPYGRDRPMFDDVRRYDEQYLSHNAQFGYGASQGGYGGGPYGGAAGKQGMYGQPHQGYGAPQSAYDQHSSSPANVGGFGQQSAPNRDGPGGSSALGSYGRTGSAQPSEGQQQYGGAGSYGGMPDVFSRSQSGYPGQTQSHGPQQANQQSGNEDSLRGYGESKGPSGPSPALGQPNGRPGSAVNSMQSQSGMPPSQGHNQSQQAYGGYPSHHPMHGQNSQYAASPGLAGHQQSAGQSHQGSGYGAYGAGFGGSYYGNNNRGGWGANYGH